MGTDIRRRAPAALLRAALPLLLLATAATPAAV